MISFDEPVHSSPYHSDTTEGDTFGGMGTSREYPEEGLRDRIREVEEKEPAPQQEVPVDLLHTRVVTHPQLMA